jgi:hypothetical protein
VKMAVETGVMGPQAKDTWSPTRWKSPVTRESTCLQYMGTLEGKKGGNERSGGSHCLASVLSPKGHQCDR